MLFLIYINDTLKSIKCNCSAFADDVFIFNSTDNLKTRNKKLNRDLRSINKWAYKWRIIFDGPKFKCIDFSKSKHQSDNPLINPKLKFTNINELICTHLISPSMDKELTWFIENGTSSISPVTSLNIA